MTGLDRLACFLGYGVLLLWGVVGLILAEQFAMYEVRKHRRLQREGNVITFPGTKRAQEHDHLSAGDRGHSDSDGA